MQLLILGGTVFLGRHLVDAAQARGHTVTLFNRGHHPESVPVGVEHIQGDRDGGLEGLLGRRWDAVIDTSGYVPRIVRTAAEALADAVDHYTFISSLSVYAEPLAPGIDERGGVAMLDDAATEEITGETYGPLKALCEQAVAQTLPGRALIIRPGLIVGPHDPTDRFTYWPQRIALGGEILAPGTPQGAVQFIDARDLAEWTIRMVEDRVVGIFNATGPQQPVPFGEVLATCQAVSASNADITWVDEAWLIGHGVAPWSDMPLWMPAEQARGFFAFDCRKAIAHGLTFRPVTETVRATLVWAATRPAAPGRAGLDPERERELLAQWHESQAG